MKLLPLLMFSLVMWWTEFESKEPQVSYSFTHHFVGDERQTVTPSEFDGWWRTGLED